MKVILCSVLLAMTATSSGPAASIQYPALGNLRAEAGTVETWYELPFDFTRIKPETLWLPGVPFRVADGTTQETPLLLRFQSIPAAHDEQGQVKRPRTDGICYSANGDASYFTYEALKIRSDQPNHLAIAWEGPEQWFYSNGHLIEHRKAGQGGGLGEPLLAVKPERSAIVIGERASPRQLLKLHAIRVSRWPLQFEPFATLPAPKADISTLLLDRFANIQQEPGGRTRLLPEHISSPEPLNAGELQGEWHRAHSTFGDCIALYQDAAMTTNLALFGLPAQE